MTTKRWYITAAVTVFAVGSGACSTGEAAEEDGPRFQTTTVERGDLSIRAEAVGSVEPVRVVEVKSKASGEILQLYADIGDVVEPGALLAEIDPRDVRNRYDQAEADFEVAQARSDIARAQLDRSTRLLEAAVITEREHETARLEQANAQAALVKAQTNLELAELQLSDASIRAPLAGTIIQKNVEEGTVIQSASQNVSGGTTLFTMANLREMQVRTLVDETDMGGLQPGMTTEITVEAYPDRTFRGVLQKIEPQAVVEQNVTMFPVIVSIDNQLGLLKPGMNAEVAIRIDDAQGVILAPNNAIVQPGDVGPAALALGLDLEAVDLSQFMRAGRGGFPGGRAGGPAGGGGPAQGQGFPGGRGAAAEGRAPGSEPRGGGGAGLGARGAFPEGLQELRAQVERGEITQDSLRSVMQGLRRGAGGGGANATASTDASPARETRPAAVFVVRADGTPEPRLVQVGLNDWDFTEVVDGLEEGETLAVVGAAQLQAQQQEFLDRMRSRTTGPFGGGGPGGGRGGR